MNRKCAFASSDPADAHFLLRDQYGNTFLLLLPRFREGGVIFIFRQFLLVAVEPMAEEQPTTAM